MKEQFRTVDDTIYLQDTGPLFSGSGMLYGSIEWEDEEDKIDDQQNKGIESEDD